MGDHRGTNRRHPGRSAHDALEALWHAIMRMGSTCWVLEVDIKSYFDTVRHKRLREMYKQRVGDGVINFVIVFSQQRDARRVSEVLPKRFGRYGLNLQEQKTRLVNFNRPGGKRRKVHGHYGYYGITFNGHSLKGYYEQVKRSWRKWLDRRSRDKHMPWERFNRLLKRYPLPQPRIVHKFS